MTEMMAGILRSSMRWSLVLACLVMAPGLCWSQVSGNIGFSQSGVKAKAEQRERGQRVLTPQELPPTNTSMFVEADVLMNVKADEYVAVFGVAQNGETVAECTEKIDAVVKEFTESLRMLRIGKEDIFVDFIAQPKIFTFELAGDIAREKLAGFEVKKNLSIRYSDPAMLDKLVVAAARSRIYDLIKVDYVVNDISAVQEKLMKEAAATVKTKISRYESLLGITVHTPAQVYAERMAIHYPADMYDSYVAAESEAVQVPPNNQKYIVERARKGKTFVFNGLDGDGFDKVVNPVIVEPVVQFTLYLKVKYEVAAKE